MADVEGQPAAGARPATADAIRDLYFAGALPRDGFEAALRELRISRSWQRWCGVLLLVLGVGLSVAGVLFLVAYNWLALDKSIRLGGLQLLILVCAGAALARGVERLTGAVLLFAACVLVGVFLAAFGQIYQTGADAWELFRAWAGLIVLWVLASRAPAHWILLLVVTDLAIALYFEQVHFQAWEREEWVWLVLAGTQAVALASFEVVFRTRYFVRPQTWPRWLLVPATLMMLAVPTTKIIIDDAYGDAASWCVLVGLVVIALGAYPFYRHSARDLFALTCMGFCAAWIVTVFVVRVLDVFRGGDCGGFLLIGVFVIGVLTLLVRWVRRLKEEFQQDG